MSKKSRNQQNWYRKLLKIRLGPRCSFVGHSVQNDVHYIRILIKSEDGNNRNEYKWQLDKDPNKLTASDYEQMAKLIEEKEYGIQHEAGATSQENVQES